MPGLNPALFLYRLVWKSLDLIYPPECGGCRRAGSRWCNDCMDAIQHIPDPVCGRCGIPVQQIGLCPDCQANHPHFHVLRSWSIFEFPIRNALHRLKYRRDIGLGDALAAQMYDFVVKLHWPINLVIPVPLGRKRLEERGYNQVGLIARPLALEMGIGFAPTALTRIRETKSQVGLTKAERHQNMCGAFQAEGTRVNGQIILLMDDVATTGSTLSSCAEALYKAGAQDVFALTVSRALTHHDLTIV